MTWHMANLALAMRPAPLNRFERECMDMNGDAPGAVEPLECMNEWNGMAIDITVRAKVCSNTT